MTDPGNADALACLRQEHADVQLQLANALTRLAQMQFIVGHELRAPLRHVSAFVQVIREDHGAILPDEVLAHLATIEEAARKMDAILDAQLRA